MNFLLLLFSQILFSRFYLKKKSFFIGILLRYSIVLVSVVQQNESAIHAHISHF